MHVQLSWADTHGTNNANCMVIANLNNHSYYFSITWLFFGHFIVHHVHGSSPISRSCHGQSKKIDLVLFMSFNNLWNVLRPPFCTLTTHSWINWVGEDD